MRGALFAFLCLACGDALPPNSGGGDGGGGGVGGSAGFSGAGAGTSCERDPLACTGACNAKGYCEITNAATEVRIPGGRVVVGLGVDTATVVEVPTFYIDKFEVTVGAYQECMTSGTCSRPGGSGTGECNLPPGFRRTHYEQMFPALVGEHPINCISWEQATAFCEKRRARLPTEAEWMLAARGPAGDNCKSAQDVAAGQCNTVAYPWGDTFDLQRANVSQDHEMKGYPFSGWTSTPVGFFDGSNRPDLPTRDGSSVYGVHDLIGNVFEWTSDDYPPTAEEPMLQGYKLMKSMGYDLPWSNALRIQDRSAGRPDDASGLTGVRCARSAR